MKKVVLELEVGPETSVVLAALESFQNMLRPWEDEKNGSSKLYFDVATRLNKTLSKKVDDISS